MKNIFYCLILPIILIGNSANAQFKTLQFEENTSSTSLEKVSIDLRSLGSISNDAIDYLGFQFDSQQLSHRYPQVLNTDIDGRPIAISYTSKSIINSRSNLSKEHIAQSYLNEVYSVLQLSDKTDGFKFISSTTDKYGNIHTRMKQIYNGIPVFGQEVFIHGNQNGYNFINGHCRHIDETINIIPKISISIVNKTIVKHLEDKINIYDIPSSLEKWIKTPNSTPSLIIYINDKSDQRLAWMQTFHANALETYEVILDAQNGEIIDYWTITCQLHNHSTKHKVSQLSENSIENTKIQLNSNTLLSPEGDETASGRDLNGRNQQFNVWKDNGRFYLIDASQAIFKANSSTMPHEPVGALWTLDGFNTSPAKSSFKVDHVQSANSSWNALSVSAHANALKAYKYYQQTHNRSSINGKGGNVVSFIRVSDENGRNMDNAFWNGQAIFYGNGNTQFKQLAGGLDVAGHEMTHGVIQNTANLIYKDEPGAINESMADVFGVMIDRGDWLLGEDIIIRSAFPSGAMRDMSDPHNGGRGLGDPGYQPAHVNEQFKGPQDNGGVHINSGIPNHAFFLFVQKMAKNSNEAQAKSKAEKVYYHALSNYLGRSSKFIDLRIAIVKSAKDLHGSNSSEAKAAEEAFSEVGIGQSSGGNYQDDLRINPGNQFFLATDANHDRLDLYNVSQGGNGVTLSRSGVLNRPSITDDGSAIVFVAKDNKIHALIRNTNGGYDETIIQNEAIWRNACIAKDGSRLAALRSNESPNIDVFDFGKGEWNIFELYNPTYTQGVSTGDVLYADAMEFEHSGQFLTYDAFSTIKSNSGSDYEYWDIGFLEVWNNTSNDWTKGEINKLFSGLPQNVSIGNPVFSKNSPYILAFDLLEDDFSGQDYQLWGANIESGKTNKLFDNGELAYANFNIEDRIISFNAADQQNNELIAQLPLQPDKITSGGQAAILLNGGQWGTWFADGSRNLDVATDNIINSEAMFSILENPVKENVVVIIEKEIISASLVFEIVDQKGTVIKIIDSDFIKLDNNIQIDVTLLAPGVYSLIMKNAGLRSQKKFIKI